MDNEIMPFHRQLPEEFNMLKEYVIFQDHEQIHFRLPAAMVNYQIREISKHFRKFEMERRMSQDFEIVKCWWK